MNALSSPDACKEFMDAFIGALRDAVIPVSRRHKDYRKWCDTVLDFIDDRIDEAFDRINEKTEKGVDKKQVRIVDELAKSTKDKHSLRYLILSIYTSAHDAVAVILSNTLFHLARYPECWTKLRAEVLPTASQPLTYELLKSYQYLNWILRESESIPNGN